MKTNFNKLEKELLRAIRGNRSQNQLNHKLGYNFNRIAKWESGAQKIPWSNFVDLCLTCRVGLPAALKRTFLIKRHEIKNEQKVVKLIIGDSPLEDIAKNLKTSKYSISSLFTGKTSPKLNTILQLINSKSEGLLYAFISELVDTKDIASIKHLRDSFETEINFFSKNPIAMGITHAMLTNGYKNLKKHKIGFIASLLNISVKEEQFLIKKLEENQIIINKNGKYILNEESGLFFIDTEGAIYWSEQCVERLKDRNKRSKYDIFHFQMSPTSSEAFLKVRELFNIFVQNATDVLDSDLNKNQDNVLLINSHIVELFKRD